DDLAPTGGRHARAGGALARAPPPLLRVAVVRDRIRRPIPLDTGGVMRSQLLLLAAGMAFVAACKSSTSPSGGGHSTTISVADFSFSPTPDTVPAGQVTFNWASGTHNVTWDTGPGTLPPNSSAIPLT